MNQLFAERFRSARILNGLSLQDLADKLNKKVSRQALHKYEKGEVIPDSGMLNLLSNALLVRPDFFYREATVEVSEVEFRKLKKLPAKEEYRIMEEVKDKVSRYLELEEILSLQQDFVNPLNGIKSIHSIQDIEEAVHKLREDWQLGNGAIFNSIELLEDHHIKVIEIDAGSSFDGVQIWVNKNIPVIAINKGKIKSADRIRFSVFHELGHLVLPIKHLPENVKEKYCHQFAAALMLPRSTIISALGQSRSKVMIQELAALKKQYGISIQAIVMRAKDLGIISESYCKQFFFFMNQMGWKVHEPAEYTGEEKSNRFDQLLFRALAEELISISKAAALKNMTVAEFRKTFLIIA